MVLLTAAEPQGGEDVTSVLRRRIRSVFITGFALTVPLVVTVMILVFVVNFILQSISPVVTFVNDAFGVGGGVDQWVLEVLAVFTFLGLVFLVGLVAQVRQGDEFERVFDSVMTQIPGIGSVYASFNEMTSLLLSNDTQSFQEVKLVEFPVEGSYTLAFITATSPDPVEGAVDHGEMTTVFLPMAPNPVMGGYVVHVSSDRVHDIDISVEEGIRSIVTSGVATGERETPEQAQLVDLQAIREQALEGVEEFTTQARRDFAAVHPDRDPSGLDDHEKPRHYLGAEGRNQESSGDPGREPSEDPDRGSAEDLDPESSEDPDRGSAGDPGQESSAVSEGESSTDGDAGEDTAEDADATGGRSE